MERRNKSFRSRLSYFGKKTNNGGVEGRCSAGKGFDWTGTTKENVGNSTTTANILLKSSDKHKFALLAFRSGPYPRQKRRGS